MRKAKDETLEESVEATEEVVAISASCENCGDSGKECVECGAGRKPADLEL